MKFTIQQARKYRNLTIEEMADFISMTPKTYIEYEKYRRYFRADKIELFLKIVDMDKNEVIFFDGEIQKDCNFIQRAR